MVQIRRWRVIARAAVLAAIVLAGGALAVATPATPSVASVETVSFSTTPALFPAFSTAVSDYVVRCSPMAPVDVSVSNSDGSDTTTTVAVAGQAPQTGSFATQVNLAQGQEFTVTVTQGAATKEYFVRCLPDWFPTWSVDRAGTPQAEYYVVAPGLTFGNNGYVGIYDTDGVPIWWMVPPPGRQPFDAKVTANGNVLWTEGVSLLGMDAEERALDGSLVHDTIVPVGAGYTPDLHEVLLLANGNYVVMGLYERCCYDLSAYGGPASASVVDNVIQEVTPAGSVVWTWTAADHIGPDEVVSQWWTQILSSSPYDIFHMNSVEVDAAGDLLISFRHDGVYKVTNPTAPANAGKVIWKLGGPPSTIEPGTKLTIVGDPVFDAGGDLGGQHYARYEDTGDGNVYVTLHDNGTNTGRPPRAVRYRVDAGAGTATLVEDVRDNVTPDLRSLCCGSAKRLPGGNWVTSWGFSPWAMELTPGGSRVFVLTLNAPSYRVDAVLPGVLTRQALRAGMDAQYQQSIADTDADGCPDVKEPLLTPPTDPANPWDFYSVPVPALIAASSPLGIVKDAAVGAADAQAVFAYFKVGAKTGTTAYEQDLNGNGIRDGVEYDRSVAGPGQSGPPSGTVSAAEAQLALAQFKLNYHC